MLDDTLEANTHVISLATLHTNLRKWYEQNKRTFPWRETKNPYHILMAELMLRRTQAIQVVRVYEEFVSRFPDVHSLANASAEEVEQVLYPLGLAWRVSAFQQIASILVEAYDGNVPASYEELLKLPGVGDYVASAVCCFGYGQARALIDTNTVRIAGRVFGIETHAELRRRKQIRAILAAMVDSNDPATYNYSMLDLAAQVCVAGRAACERCPLVLLCKTGKDLRIKQV